MIPVEVGGDRADYPSGDYDALTYDAIGNRTSWRGHALPRLHDYKNGANPNNGQRLRNDGQGPFHFTYDANGNTTKESHGLTYTRITPDASPASWGRPPTRMIT